MLNSGFIRTYNKLINNINHMTVVGPGQTELYVKLKNTNYTLIIISSLNYSEPFRWRRSYVSCFCLNCAACLRSRL